jgi:hypothetical protein
MPANYKIRWTENRFIRIYLPDPGYWRPAILRGHMTRPAEVQKSHVNPPYLRFGGKIKETLRTYYVNRSPLEISI